MFITNPRFSDFKPMSEKTNPTQITGFSDYPIPLIRNVGYQPFDGQHWDACESRANFGIYVGNQKHPNLSTRTYGFNHVFYYGVYNGISGVKIRLN